MRTRRGGEVERWKKAKANMDTTTWRAGTERSGSRCNGLQEFLKFRERRKNKR